LQEHSEEYDKIYLVGHSIGGLIIEEALDFSSKNKNRFPYLDSVSKAILVATPNLGSPSFDVYENFRENFVNIKSVEGLYNSHKKVLDIAVSGKKISAVDTIDYYAIAGLKPYEFNAGLFNLAANDGVITTKSARTVDGKELTSICNRYFELNLSHAELVSDPESRRVIQYIISSDRIKENPAYSLVGYNQYLHTVIDGCMPGEVFVAVGKTISESAAYAPADCNCGNGVCGEGETALNCPIDCANVLSLAWCANSPAIMPWLFMIAIILIIVYFIAKQRRKKQSKKLLKIGSYIMIVLTLLSAILAWILCAEIYWKTLLLFAVLFALLLADPFLLDEAKEKLTKKVKKKK